MLKNYKKSSLFKKTVNKNLTMDYLKALHATFPTINCSICKEEVK